MGDGHADLAIWKHNEVVQPPAPSARLFLHVQPAVGHPEQQVGSMNVRFVVDGTAAGDAEASIRHGARHCDGTWRTSQAGDEGRRGQVRHGVLPALHDDTSETDCDCALEKAINAIPVELSL